ncbi:MAG: RagB/SusD family nutrient uptake outer membrane protein [Odoribacter sp.]
MKINNYIVGMCFVLLTGCSGFLDEVDKDKLIPSTTEHYSAVLLKEFAGQQAYFGGSDFMSDNVGEYAYMSEESRKNWKPIYTWQLEIELDENGERVNNNTVWQGMYEDVAVANYVLELIDEAAGSQEERDFIKGEAYFVRGWSYLMLANLYGAPYRPVTAQTDLGVILRTDNEIEQTYQRASLAETYRQITGDLLEAKRLIAASGVVKSKLHPSVSACDLLLSRTYLYMQDWEKAEASASEVIKTGSLSRMTSGTPYATEARGDVLYSCLVQMGASESSLYEKGWRVNNELIDLYAAGDLRVEAFFEKIPGKMGRVYYPRKRTKAFSELGYDFLRVSEAYLNRAEARYHNGGDAGGDLRALLETRYSDKASVTIAAGDALLEQILTERRKELCFEGHHRWFDLRRISDRPTVTHDFTLTDADGNTLGTQRYTLFPDDLNYTLPIPLKERDNNPLIRNNERYEKLPENV